MLTDRQLEQAFGQHDNVAIITGVLSGIAVLDADDEIASGWVARNAPSPWGWRSAKGIKRAYRLTDPLRSRDRIFGAEGVAIDLKAEGGCVIGPGSRHRSGVLYELEGDWSVPKANLPPLPALVVAQLQRLSAPVVSPPSMSSSTPADRSRDPHARAVAYLAASDSPSKGTRRNMVFKMACKLLDFGVSVENAVTMLAPWSGLSVVEVRRETNGAAKRRRSAC